MADQESIQVTEDQPEPESLAGQETGVMETGPRTEPSESGTNENTDVPEPKVIEVERKFVIPNDCKSKLAELGAELLNMSEFTDIYFDVDQYTLTKKDIWLRTRGGKFELKFPVVNKDVNTPSTQYHEFDTDEEILGKISDVFGADPGSRSLPEFLSDVKCTAFSTYTTKRLSYALDDFTIVLDETDFGFSIGEIERIVVSGDRISEALVAIDGMAEKLGFMPFATAPFPQLLGQQG